MLTASTRFVGLKEFRANMSSLLKKANTKGIRYILMNHSIPIGEFLPFSKRKQALDQLTIDITKARAQVKKGQVRNHEEVMKEFGL